MNEKNYSGPAFPCEIGSTGENWHQTGHHTAQQYGMTLREYAAIELRIPDSGKDWLDDMIRASLRKDFAAKAMQGMMSAPGGFRDYDWKMHNGKTIIENTAIFAYDMADAMLKAREK